MADARSAGHAPSLAIALAGVAAAEETAGDTAAAADHLSEASELLRPLAGAESMLSDLLARAGRLALKDGDPSHAIELFAERIDMRRRWIAAEAPAYAALRDLTISLSAIGEAYREAGNLIAATTAYEQALTLSRRLVDDHNETPETLRDLSISLKDLGDARLAAGDLAAATAAHEEALTLDRRLLDTYGETT